MHRRDRSLQEYAFPQRRRTPSFSSTLLDAIYRSIDDSRAGQEQEEFNLCRGAAMIKKQSNCSIKREISLEEAEKRQNLRRAVLIEKWMEKRSTHGPMHFISTSSSSECSSGGVFSSSEAESSYKEKSSSSSFTMQRAKSVRTIVAARSEMPEKCLHFEQGNLDKQQKPKIEGGFSKTKLRALKIYGELKKVKQPISPGGRISSFLNSIFNSGNAKKVKICSVRATEDVTLESKSKPACSSGSSFSRSCLSKAPSSRAKSSNGVKRSVRFYPVSVIVDEHCRPCGHKCIYEDDPSLMPLPTVHKNCVKEKNNGVGALSRGVFRSYQKKSPNEFNLRSVRDDDNDSDADSYASSDLFELDNLIGIGRYREELPVYETTSLKTNQAIANGFFL